MIVVNRLEQWYDVEATGAPDPRTRSLVAMVTSRPIDSTPLHPNPELERHPISLFKDLS